MFISNVYQLPGGHCATRVWLSGWAASASGRCCHTGRTPSRPRSLLGHDDKPCWPRKWRRGTHCSGLGCRCLLRRPPLSSRWGRSRCPRASAGSRTWTMTSELDSSKLDPILRSSSALQYLYSDLDEQALICFSFVPKSSAFTSAFLLLRRLRVSAVLRRALPLSYVA